MKNQYFGDINDYQKYSLLRTITQVTRLRLAVCWMLTPDDGRSDGRKTAYLHNSAKWRSFDPELYDVLKAAVTSSRRCIQVAEDGRILPRAVFQSAVLHDDRTSRAGYFDRLEILIGDSDLVFFDPDNGMEVKSKPKGRKGSSKYLYWDEAKRISGLGKSLIAYQHFARVKRDVFVADLCRRFQAECGTGWVGVLRTANVAYFVIPAKAHEAELQTACAEARRKWDRM